MGAVQEAVVEAAPGVADKIGNTAVTVGKSRLHLCWEAFVLVRSPCVLCSEYSRHVFAVAGKAIANGDEAVGNAVIDAADTGQK